MARLTSRAPAKVNLTLRVLGRRPDGYHELASLVAFAAIGDELALEPGPALAIEVGGPTAAASGPVEMNLVLAAARALADRIEGLRLGRFDLTKRLPVGAGLGGGSADAAAALRLLAQANDVALDDPRLLDAARTTGADVPVCLDPRARLMHGTGDALSAPLKLPELAAVLVYPAVPISTAAVFRAFQPAPGNRRDRAYAEAEIPKKRAAFFQFLNNEANDLERTARSLVPAISAALEAIDENGGAEVIRMSGSGSCMFGLYDGMEDAEEAAEGIRDDRPEWWVTATTLN